MILGLDASNLLTGGGRTHLVELLAAAEPAANGFERVVVWGTAETLQAIADRPWLEKVRPNGLAGGAARRLWWQLTGLPRECRTRNCDLLFVPGGTAWGGFRPMVTMCRNMLPFDKAELRRYGASRETVRLLLLRWLQARGFRRAAGVVFLSEHARQAVERQIGRVRTSTVIPHAVHDRFRKAPRPQGPINDYHDGRPFRLLYVSSLAPYKHQWHVAEAVAALRSETGWSLTLEFIGGGYPSSRARLKACLDRIDPARAWAHVLGEVPHGSLPGLYQQADVGVFASTCENLPNIVIEMMAAGLSIACSNRARMPELLGEGGVYFDPESPSDIAAALRRLLDDPAIRERAAAHNYQTTAGYSWNTCASRTFRFLAEAAQGTRTGQSP